MYDSKAISLSPLRHHLEKDTMGLEARNSVFWFCAHLRLKIACEARTLKIGMQEVHFFLKRKENNQAHGVTARLCRLVCACVIEKAR